jgi:uncharacterized lipoprotein YehR (DUF1307 family)
MRVSNKVKFLLLIIVLLISILACDDDWEEKSDMEKLEDASEILLDAAEGLNEGMQWASNCTNKEILEGNCPQVPIEDIDGGN